MAPPGNETFISLVGYDRQYLETSYIATQNITKGKDHRFRYRAQNAAGWSGFSSISYLRAATVPQSPSKPVLLARSSTSVTIGMSQTLDDGGSQILYNELFIGGENDTSSTFTLVSAYDGSSSTFIFNTTDSPALIVTGSIYKIAYVAHNSFGDSAFDSQLTVGVGRQPPAPTNLVEGTLNVDPSLLNIVWNKVTTSDLPILGYIVQMDDGLGGDFSVVYNGETNPQVTSYTATKLNPGRQYRFTVQAVDINGAGDLSSILTLYACVIPSGLDRPNIVGVSGTSYTVSWSNPLSDGGCKITSISIYRDNGVGGDLTTLVATITDGSLKYTDTLTSTDQGNTFRVAVVATNTIGGVTSSATSFVLASLPAAPTPVPYADNTLTNIYQIVVHFEDTNTNTGGAPILEYCLQMDDGIGGEFSTVFCSTHETTYAAKNVTRGGQYRFRYQVMNAVGWSPYSETSYISPTSIPDAPPKPQFVSGTDTQIVLSFQESPDNNGVPILKYQLEIDSGNNLTSSFHKVTGYSGLVMSYTLDATVDSLGTPGTIYRVRLVAINEDSVLGEYSDVLLVALGSLPSKPSTPTKVISSSTSSLISIQWSEVTGDTLPIQGYKLYSDSGRADALLQWCVK